jgi:FdhD protein
MHPVATLPLMRLVNDGTASDSQCVAPEEAAIAFIVNGIHRGFAMSTPADLEDLAVGVCLSQGLIRHASQVTDLVVHVSQSAIELRMAVSSRANVRSLESACHGTGYRFCANEPAEVQPVPDWLASSKFEVSPDMIKSAMEPVRRVQSSSVIAQRLHTAAMWRPNQGVIAVREDLDCQHAFEKLIGTLARADVPTHDGLVAVTGGASMETVLKAAQLGAPVLITSSMPTTLAVRTAEKWRTTLIVAASDGSLEVFSHADRVASSKAAAPVKTEELAPVTALPMRSKRARARLAVSALTERTSLGHLHARSQAR